MQKFIIALLAGAFSLSVFAQQGGFVATENQNGAQSGFSGPGPALISTQQAKKLPDDAWVALEGHITKQISHEHYEFRDDSGTVVVEIDDKYWAGQRVTPQDKVRLEGEVDKDWNSFSIDVKRVRVLQ